MKLGKEISIKAHQNYSSKIGSMNRRNPRAVYFEITAWASPNEDSDNYKKLVRRVHKNLKTTVNNSLDRELFSSDFFIVDFDLRESGIKLGKRSFMCAHITLYQRKDPKQLEEIKANLEVIVQKVIEYFEENPLFDFHKTKKKKSPAT